MIAHAAECQALWVQTLRVPTTTYEARFPPHNPYFIDKRTELAQGRGKSPSLSYPVTKVRIRTQVWMTLPPCSCLWAKTVLYSFDK